MKSMWVLLLSLEIILFMDYALCKPEEDQMKEHVADPKLKLKDGKPDEHPNPYNWQDGMGDHPMQYDPSWGSEGAEEGANPYDWRHGGPPPGMDAPDNPNPYDWQKQPYKRHMEIPDEGMAGDHPSPYAGPYDRRSGQRPSWRERASMDNTGYERDSRSAVHPGMHVPDRRDGFKKTGEGHMREEYPRMDRRGFAYARPWGKDRKGNNQH